MTATEIELRKENAGLRDDVKRLQAEIAHMVEDDGHVRDAFTAAIDQHVADMNTRHRILLTVAAELLMTAVALGDEKRPGPPTGTVP
jgi:hypothetical protein